MLPLVSVVVPTRNRRPFIDQLIRGYLRQDYPLDRMEMIVADDGEDAVGDLFARMPGTRYLRLPQVLPIGAKRNLLAREARGDIIVHMDDDDYYPPTRVSHSVGRLRGEALLAGASEMYIYDLQSRQAVRSGPFGAFHATANTLAYRREYLELNRFDDAAMAQEEPSFTRGFSSPMVQLDSRATLLCVSHSANTFSKQWTTSNPAPLRLKDLVPCKDALRFYRYQLPRRLGLDVAQA